MKRAIKMNLIIVAWMVLSQVAAVGSDEAPTNIPTGSPAAVAVNPEYQFETTVEGLELTHDFIFKNTGTAVLEIEKVKTG